MDVDIDNEFDGELLNQFRSLGTTDRDVLIAEFRAVLGNTLNPESCAFYLDMNNWNLQNAVCSYYDLEQPVISLPSMQFVADITTGNGEAVAPNTTFIKTWRIKNAGIERWPPGCRLSYHSGENLGAVERVTLTALDPGQCTDISVEMRSPAAPGIYHCIWRSFTPTGNVFGDLLQWSIEVTEGGLLSLTQQLARINGGAPAVTMLGEENSSNLPQAQDQPTSVGMDVQQQPQDVVLYSIQPCTQLLNTTQTQSLSTVEEDDEMS